LSRFSENTGGASRRKCGRFWPDAKTWWRSISRVSRSCAAGSCVPDCRRRSDGGAADRVRRRERDVVGGILLDDLGEQRDRRGDAAHVAGDVRAHLVVALGAVGALQRREIDRRRPRLFVVGGHARARRLRPRAR
jgi:hypothetical protein